MKRNLLYVLMFIVSLITLEAQETIQPQWISPAGSIRAVSDDKTKFLMVGRFGFTYTDIKKDTSYTLLFENPYMYSQSAAMSSDGRYIVFVKGMYDSTKVWIEVKTLEALSGKELRAKKIDLEMRYLWGINVVINSNNLLIFTGGVLLITDFLDDSDSRIVSDIGYNYSKLKISPKGNYMLETVGDTIIKIWETKAWSLHGTLKRDIGYFSFVNFSPNDTKLVTKEEYPHNAKVWDLETMSLVSILKDDIFYFKYASFSRNEDSLVMLGDFQVSIWNVDSGKKIKSYERDTSFPIMKEVFFNDKGDKILATRENGTMWLWRVKDGSTIGKIESNTLLLITNDSGVFGDTLITVQNGQPQTNIWALSDKGITIVDSIVSYDEVVYAVFANDDKYVRLLGSFIQTLDASSKRKVGAKTEQGRKGRFYKTIGPFAIYATNSENEYYVEVRNLEKDEKILQIPPSEDYYLNILFCEDGNKIFIDRKDYDSNARIVSAYDVKKKEYYSVYKDSLSSFGKKYYTSLSPDGKKALMIVRDSFNHSLVRVLDVSTGVESDEFFIDTNYNSTGSHKPICTALFSPDGKQILITDSKRFVYIFDAETYTLLHTFDNGVRKMGWRESVKAVYSKSSEILAVFGLERTMDLWNPKTGQKIITLPHQQNVLNIQFNKTENELMTSCADNNLYGWDINTGKVKYVLEGSKDTLLSVNYSNNGRKVIATQIYGPALLWNLPLATQAIEYEEPISKGQFLNIYPNPTNNEITISFASQYSATQYSILNQQGENLVSGFIPKGDDKHCISLGSLPTGIYLFSTEINGKKVHERFVVKRW